MRIGSYSVNECSTREGDTATGALWNGVNTKKQGIKQVLAKQCGSRYGNEETTQENVDQIQIQSVVLVYVKLEEEL